MNKLSTYTFLLLVLSAISLKAQDMPLDSNYVKETIRLAQNETDLEVVFDQMENALLVARSINYTEGKTVVANWLAEYYQAKGDNIAALRYYLELLEGQQKATHQSGQKATLLSIAQIYETEQLGEKALEYYRLLLPLSMDKTAVWERLGATFLQENQTDSAAYYFTKVYQVAKATQDYELTLKALQQQAAASQQAERYGKVLDYNKKILYLVEAEKDAPLLATCYNNIGYNYNQLKDYENAILYFEKAEEANQKGNELDDSILYTNLGIAAQNIGDLSQAIKYFRKARVTLVKERNPLRFAYLTHLIATVYYKNDDLYNALIFNDEAIVAAKVGDNKTVLSDSYNIGASIHQDLYDYEKALTYYKQHLALRDSFLLEQRLRQQALLQQQYLLERAEKEIKILISNQEIQDLNMNQLNLEKDKLELSASAMELEAEKRESELALLRKEQEIQDASLKNNELEAFQTQQTLRLTAQQLEAEKRDREISDLNRKEAEQSLALAKKTAEEEERLKEIDLLNKDKELLTRQQEIAQLEIDKQSAFRQLVYGLGGLAAVILGLILAGLLFARRANKRLAQKNIEIETQKSEIEKNRDIIQHEKAKSDALLLNILPAETAKELREVGAATPQKYELVSVLFTDFSGFTAISKHMSPEQLIRELNDCFMAFDEIVERYGLEKIKTIGDAYMCAGGLPTPNQTNPQDVIYAAIDMRAFMNQWIVKKQESKQRYWDMRIGVHTGGVIAGVVGKKKFAYDIWGDTVNIASRMESNGVEGKINISAATYVHIKNDFECTYRGAIPVKNGGEVEMYFVE